MGVPTDPGRLWAYQVERRKQWDTIYLIIIILSLTAPIGFAITRAQPSQVLKLSYPFFALFIALAALGLASATSFFSLFFSLAACILVVVILMPGIQWVIDMSPSPEWYVYIIPLLVLLFLVTESLIPQKEHFEWASAKLSPHGLNKQQLSIINQKGSLGTSAQKVFTNITSVKPESVWVNLLKYLFERQNSGSDRVDSQNLTNSVDRDPNSANTKSSSPPARYQAIEHLDELYALQRQADDSLQQIRTSDPEITNTLHAFVDTIPTPPPPSTPLYRGNPPNFVKNETQAILSIFQDAHLRNDISVLMKYNPIELIISGETADAWIRGLPDVVPRLEIVKAGGNYLLVKQAGNWLFPTFKSISRLSINEPSQRFAKGIFVIQRETISTPALRRPAELKQVGDLWEVVSLGLIAVPG